MLPPIENLSVPDLLKLHSQLLMELRKRGVLRTNNNPIGDYTEWLVAAKLNLTLVGNSTASYDAISDDGVKYQIKSRTLLPNQKSRQLSPVRNLGNHGFDFLIAVLYDGEYIVQKALKIPHLVVERYATYRTHVNGHILHLRGAILADPDVEDISVRLI